MRALRFSLLAIALCVLGMLGWRSMQSRPVRIASAPAVAPHVVEPAPAPAPVPQIPVLPAPEPLPAAPPAPVVTAPAPAPGPAMPEPGPASPAPGPVRAPNPAVSAPPRPAPAPAPAEATADQRIAEVSEFANFYEKLRTTFPQDYDAFRAGLAAARPMPSADAAIWDAMRNLQQARGVLAASADAPNLDHYFDARSAMVAGLAPLNPRLCADFLLGQAGASIAEFTASHRGLVATLAERQLAAITDGLAEHVERTSPTDADFDALSAALKTRGLSPEEIGYLVDGVAPDPPLQDARLCAIGETYLEALHDLPPDTRNRIYGLAAELLARS